ncbi:ribonuclease HII [Lapidilactobacillus luobeiensis]|uniref:ribonuclease HII n=1 Tax=Lapidilactobacillus luobeiensis TaxID=2950371 RepID=UPI0021C2BE43|nr:ribonuclease HII [Lapidilactobacillus luobeiensis]
MTELSSSEKSLQAGTTLAAIKARLNNAAVEPVDPQWLLSLQADPRVGVQRALQQYQHRLVVAQQAQVALQARLRLEQHFWPQYPLIAGVDEVGRGPLAGPVVTAAVILPHDFNVTGVDDSKRLSAKRRAELYPQILSQAVAVGIGVGDAALIDQENIYHATELTMAQAIHNLTWRPQLILVDAMTIPVPIKQEKLIKGDQKSASIAAASIVAKQIRDHLMAMYDQVYPGYDFAHNAGYGTAAHLAGLTRLGPCPIHRHSFSPVQAVTP